MSELLVRTVSQESSDPFVNARISKRGDVIVAFEDGHTWGRHELSDPSYRILQLPGLSVSDVAQLLSEEAALSPEPDPMLQYRGFYLDLDAQDLSADLATHLADTTRQNAVLAVEPAVVLALVTQRPRLANPNVIG